MDCETGSNYKWIKLNLELSDLDYPKILSAQATCRGCTNWGNRRGNKLKKRNLFN